MVEVYSILHISPLCFLSPCICFCFLFLYSRCPETFKHIHCTPPPHPSSISYHFVLSDLFVSEISWSVNILMVLNCIFFSLFMYSLVFFTVSLKLVFCMTVFCFLRKKAAHVCNVCMHEFLCRTSRTWHGLIQERCRVNETLLNHAVIVIEAYRMCVELH